MALHSMLIRFIREANIKRWDCCFAAIMMLVFAMLFGFFTYLSIGHAIEALLQNLAVPPVGNDWAKLLVWFRAEYYLVGAVVSLVSISTFGLRVASEFAMKAYRDE